MKKPIFNVLWSLAGLGSRTIIQVAYFILLARVLGPEDYGALSASFAIINTFVPYAAWGAGDFLVKNVSRDREKFSRYWGSALLSIVIFGSVFFLLTFFFYFLLLSEQVHILTFILLCLSEFIFVQIVNITIQSYQAFELISRTAVVQFTFSFLRLLFTIVFVVFIRDHKLVIWVSLYLFCTFLAAISCLTAVRIELGRAFFRLSDVKENLLEKFYFSVGSSSRSIYNDFDKSILPKYATLEITGNYSAAYRMIDALCIPINAILQTFYARFFVKGKDGLAASRRFAIRLFPVFFFYSLCAVIGVLLFSKDIPLVFGDSYKEAVDIIKILSPVIVFRAIHSLGADALTGASMQGKRSAAQVFVAVLNAGLCLMLIPRNGWLGAIWASLVSDGVLALLIWIIIVSSSQTMGPNQRHLGKQEPTTIEQFFD